jgi:uncharacterized phage protein (TIGR02218 family)
MTSRLPSGSLATKRYRSHEWCELVRITRKDGFSLRMTSHDKQLMHQGLLYEPLDSAQHSNERRETGLKDANLQLFGALSSSTITNADLAAGKYDGAEIIQRVVNWRHPERIYYEAQKWLVRCYWDGAGWKADIVGHTKWLTQPAAGRFGGTYSVTCPYKLGDAATCKKDISALIRTSTVSSVIAGTTQFRGTAGTWTSPPFADDYFKEGEIIWTSGANSGLVSPITAYTDATREVILLIPTPFTIAVGDAFTAKPGCDGTRTTCIGKFSNLANFGGVGVFSPGSSPAMEVLNA